MQQYQLTRPISGGGMGQVYEGRKLTPLDNDKDETRPVAIKVVPPRDIQEEERHAAELFCREAVQSWRISHEHPNLVTTYDYGISAKEFRYLVMELVDGVSVREIIHDRDRLDYGVIRRIVRDTLAGLAHLHRREWLHRDVTARNILISRAGEVKLADFGLIKAAYRSGSEYFRGTPQFSAPEALQCRGLGPLADLYSVGVVLYLLLTGGYPYGDDRQDTVHAMLLEQEPAPIPDDTPADLTAIVYGLIALRAKDRKWRHANDVIAFIDDHGQPVASDADMAEVVEDRAPARPPRSADANDLPALGWPFEELPTPAPEPHPSRWHWLPWALLPLAFIAGIAVFALTGNRSPEVTSVTPIEAQQMATPMQPASIEAPTAVTEAPTATDTPLRPAVDRTRASIGSEPTRPKGRASSSGRSNTSRSEEPGSREIHGHIRRSYPLYGN